MRSVNQNSNRKSIASPNPGSKKLIRKIRHSHPQKERSGKEKRRRWRALINTTHPRARTYLHRSQSHARKSLGDLATMAWHGAVGPARYPTGGCQGARHRRGYLLHRELMTPRLLVTHICVGVCVPAQDGWPRKVDFKCEAQQAEGRDFGLSHARLDFVAYVRGGEEVCGCDVVRREGKVVFADLVWRLGEFEGVSL